MLYTIVNCSQFARVGPHWDEILDWQGQATDTYLIAGRWGTYLYRIILGKGAMPWLGGIVAGIYISGAVVLQTKLLKLDSVLLKILYAAIYIACNQWASQCIYSFQCDSIALGVLLSSFSVYILIRKNNIFSASLLLTLSMSSYQSNGLYWFVLWSAVVLMQRLIQKKQLVYAFLTGVISIILYFVIQKICMLLVSPSPEMIAYVEGYQRTTSNWYGLSSYSPMLQFMCFAHYFKQSLYQAFGWGDSFSLAIFTAIIPVLILLAINIRKRIGLREKITRLFLIIALWYAPYVLTFLMLGFVGDRVILAAPVSLASLWLLSFTEFPLSRKGITITLSVVFLLLIKGSYDNCVNARDAALCHEVGVQQLHHIYSHGRKMAEDAKQKELQILLFFDTSHVIKEEDSIFPQYMTNGVLNWYTRHYKLHNMRLATADELYACADTVKNMPCWPDLRSIQVFQDKIIVKIPQVKRD